MPAQTSPKPGSYNLHSYGIDPCESDSSQKSKAKSGFDSIGGKSEYKIENTSQTSGYKKYLSRAKQVRDIEEGINEGTEDKSELNRSSQKGSLTRG